MNDKRMKIEDSNLNNKATRLKKEHIKRKKLKFKKRKKRIRRIVVSLILLVLTLVVGFGIYIYSFLGGLNNDNSLPSALPSKANEPINVLVVGMDIGDTENLGNKSIRRTDSIMVVNYNPNTKKMNVVSIPRDTMIEEDAYLEGGQYQRYWKINNAYVLGGEDCLIKHVESLLNIKINNIVEIDYNAFRNLVDVVGPIEMYIKQDMIYDDDSQNLHINFKAGETVQLDGKKAEEFFRWRKNNDGSGLAMGDIDRINNQHEFISKLIEKCFDPSIIFKVPDILKAVSDNVVTNLSANNIVSLGLKAITLKQNDIVMSTLNGEFQDIYNQSYFIVDKESNLDLINSLNATLQKEVPVEINKEKLNILILNATSTSGLAGNLKSELIGLGYKNIEVGNSAPQGKSTIQTNDIKIEDILKSDIDISKTTSIKNSENEKYDAVIVLGQDYNIFGQ